MTQIGKAKVHMGVTTKLLVGDPSPLLPPVVTVEAELDGEILTSTVTLGPVDAPAVELDQDKVQSIIDSERAKLAAILTSRKRLRDMLAKVE